MSVQKPNPQVKYELLDDYYTRNVLQRSYLWSAFGLIFLIIFISVVLFYLAVEKILFSEKKHGAVDFIMFGPDRLIPGHVGISQRRAEMYSAAAFGIKNNSFYNQNNSNTNKETDLTPFSTLQLANIPSTTTDESIVNSAMKLVCYYSIPINDSTEEQLLPDSIDPFLCTHIIVAFAFITKGILQPGPQDISVYKQVIEMKKQNPNLKVMLSIQCFSNTGEFAEVVDSHYSRKRFINSSLNILKEYSFDGIDIDWEFPVWPSYNFKQKRDFNILLGELRAAFETYNSNLLISVAVAAPESIASRAYDISEMAKYVDFVNLMSYDFHYYTSYLPITGPNAPLYLNHIEHGVFSKLNSNYTVYYWLSNGMPIDKIIIGLPTYGHSFTLMNSENSGWNAPAVGFGQLGSDGFVQYPDICRFLKRNGTKIVFDDEYKVPYAVYGKEWISYDDEISLGIKAQYAKTKGLGGVMVYALNDDDYKATCASNDFFLIRNIKYILEDDQL